MVIQKKVLVLLGHPDPDSSCGIFASSYEEGARKAGHDVKRINISDLNYDPILHKGYKVVQVLEPDLINLQNDFRWADHITLVYPNWWGTMPALLKGLFDRFFLPGFAFKFSKNEYSWERLLRGKTGRVFITMDATPWLARILFGDNSNEIRSAIFGFAGISTYVTKIGPLKNITPGKKEIWRKRVFEMGEKAK